MARRRKTTATALRLPERCGLDAAREIAAAAASAEDGRLTVEADGVARMSAPATMALVAAARSLAAAKGAVVIRAPSPAFTEAFSDLGLFADMMTMEFAE